MAASVADLFDRFHLAIFRYLLRMTGRRDLAEDLTQDVFVRLLRGAAGLDLAGAERAWLFQVARNLLVDWRRRAGRNPVTEGTEALADETSAPMAASQEDDFLVHEALAQLPEADRDAFLLRVVGGLGHEEIAAISGSSAASVRSRIFRARSALRGALAGRSSQASDGQARDIRRFRVVP